MSLFSLDNIILNENTIAPSVEELGYEDTNIDYSFVQEGYNFIISLCKDSMDAEKVFFESILDSHGDDNIINESFSGFFESIKNVIKKFIAWIKKVFKEFINKINSLVSSEKYLKKNKDLFNKFSSEDEFEYNGFKFTYVIDSSKPVPAALSAFDSDTNGKGYLSSSNWYAKPSLNIEDDSSKADIDSQTNTLNTQLDDRLRQLNDGLDDFYDVFRGRVIGTDKIYSSDFAEELFKFFRDNDSSPSSITIDATYVSEAYRRFDNYKDTIKAIEKNQKEIIKDYEALEKYLDKLIKVNKADSKLSLSSASDNNYVSGQINDLGGVSDLNNKVVYNTSTTDKMNNYLKAQSTKINQMCSIHTQAFSAKLEAAKDQFKQDKKILYKALQQITKRSNKKGF